MLPVIGILTLEKVSSSAIYLEEILSHAGLFWRSVRLPVQRERCPDILIVPEQGSLSSETRAFLEAFVRGGGGLLGLGGTSGLDDLFGARAGQPLVQGYLRPEIPSHPVIKKLESSLHVFGGMALSATGGEVMASLLDPSGERVGDAIVTRPFGKGQTLVIGPDLSGSVLHIQQGIPVVKDGVPAPDGSAPIDDGILKGEDGMVLDWVKDRQAANEQGNPIFRKPIGDELREILIRAALWLGDRLGVTLPVLWYWPRYLPAVGMMSHDTDSNEPDKGWALLEVMRRQEVKSCWCIIYPGGYPPELYRALIEQGYEIATHYDAMTGGRFTSWGKDNFDIQHQWLLDMSGVGALASNKNHYTRWEGRLDFFRWCEEKGIRADQTKGPSKRGSIGFVFGGAHPWFVLDDEAAPMRFMEVLEINMLTQDTAVTCPSHFGPLLVDEAVRLHGVAHFLFHPAHILKDGVADALAHVIARGREQGIEWWTSEAIYRWEKARRSLCLEETAPGRWLWTAGSALPQVTLLALQPSGRQRRLALNGNEQAGRSFEAFGFRFAGITCDLSAGQQVRLEARD